MILFIHILFAIFSILYSIAMLIKPNNSKVKNIYKLTSVTITTGLFLAISTPSSFGQFCLSGLMYIGIIAICIIFGKRSPSYSR